MHDPMTVAFEIRYPWKAYPASKARGEFERNYRRSFITIWHVDPEKDGSDDSCGWFMRVRHGNKDMFEKIKRAFASEWDGEHIGWFLPSGMPVLSVQATALGLFRRAAYIHFGSSWEKTDRFLRRHLLDIITFAENRHDSFSDSLTMRYGPSPKEDRVSSAAAIVYGCILRWSRPWYRAPRWHVWHWKLQIHPLQEFKRWAFSRCCKCGGRFSWGYSPCSNNWNGGGASWFGEKGVYHSDCANPKSNGASQVAQG